MTRAVGVRRRLLRAQRRRVAVACALFMSWQAGEALVPVVIGAVIDHAIERRHPAALLGGLVLLGGLFLTLSLSFRFASRHAAAAVGHAEHELRAELVAAVLDPRRRPDPSTTSGELLSVATSDAQRTARIASLIPQFCGAIVSVTVVTVVLLSTSWLLGLIVVAGAPPMLFAARALGAPLERRAGVEQHRAAEASAVATDLVLGLRVLKGIGAERVAARRYRAASRRALDATRRAAAADARYAASTLLLTLLFLALVAYVGGRLAAQGRISVGELVAAVGLAQFLLGPLAGLAAGGALLARSRACAARVQAVLDAPRPAGADATLARPIRGELRVRQPGYLLTVAAGEIVAVVTEPGEGAALISALGLAAHEEGISLDGQPLTAVAPRDAGAALLVAGHDHVLFDEPAGAAVQVPGAEPSLVGAALAAADADQVLAGLPGGASSRLGERGTTLSGGQRQRLMLARALAADPPVLVLHDPTTAVDAATEARIADGLRRLRAGRSTLVVTTSPALLAVCDRVLLIEGGRLRAQGRHQRLAAECAGYRELVFG